MSTKNERNSLHSIEFRVGVQQKCNDCGLNKRQVTMAELADHRRLKASSEALLTTNCGSSNFLLSCQFSSVTKFGGVYVCVVCNLCQGRQLKDISYLFSNIYPTR